MPKINAYIFSGLGVDHRIFQNIQFPDSIEPIHISWIEPEKKETFTSYCQRLSKQINQKHPFVFIGLSFGGITAVEMSKLLHPEKIILISSASTKDELPLLYRLAGKTLLIKLIPTSLFKNVNFIYFYLFGVKSKTEKLLLKEIISDTSVVFLKWAIGCLINWNNIHRPTNLIHIHGKKDKLIYYRDTSAEISIEDGEHFMVFTRAAEISKLLKNLVPLK